MTEKNLNIYDVYIDDGYTGLDFNRPEFKRMLRDIEEDNIKTVITKDMSRLGRDYIMVGYYLERFFPENNIRYISINDNIDTKEAMNYDMTPFKALVNDMYSKDISKKIKSVLDYKRSEGLFIGSFAPYGYEKEPVDKNKLVIDKKAARVVKKIFNDYIKGEGLKSIAENLNKESIYSPALYKMINVKGYKHHNLKKYKWTHGGVRSILTNYTYTGNMTQGKSKKLNYKSKKMIKIDRVEWIVVEKTHPQIISEHIFNKAQSLLNSKNRKRNRHIPSLFRVAVCGDCGEAMTPIHYKEYSYLICSTYKKKGKSACTRHSIRLDRLTHILNTEIKTLLGDKLHMEKYNITQESLNNIEDNMKDMDKEIEGKKISIKIILKQLEQGLLREEDFYVLYNGICEDRQALRKRKDQLIKEKEELQNRGNEKENNMKINDEVLTHLIDKIEIYENDLVKIYFN